MKCRKDGEKMGFELCFTRDETRADHRKKMCRCHRFIWHVCRWVSCLRPYHPEVSCDHYRAISGLCSNMFWVYGKLQHELLSNFFYSLWLFKEGRRTTQTADLYITKQMRAFHLIRTRSHQKSEKIDPMATDTSITQKMRTERKESVDF